MPASDIWALRAVGVSGSSSVGSIAPSLPQGSKQASRASAALSAGKAKSLRSACQTGAGRSLATLQELPMLMSSFALNSCQTWRTLQRPSPLRSAPVAYRKGRGSAARWARADAGSEMASSASVVSSQKDIQASSTSPSSLPPLPEKRTVVRDTARRLAESALQRVRKLSARLEG